MVNELQASKRISVIKKQMNDLLKGIASAITNGEIKTEAELQNIVYHTLENFYRYIGKSTFKQIPAVGAPFKDDHHQMTMAILNDLYTLFDEISLMTDDIESNFEQVEMERQSFIKRIKDIESIVTTIESKAKKKSDIIIFQDYFSNTDYFDENKVNGVAAHLSFEDGFLMLNKLREENFNEYATITIVEGNGIPGSTHVVRAIDNKLKFDGQDEMHNNMGHILDNNLDTWFEYEVFTLTKEAKTITQGRNLMYSEGIKWAHDDIDGLRCVIKIELEKERMINWINLIPYIPGERGASGAIIEKIVITDDKWQTKAITFEESFHLSRSFIFPQQNIKGITIYLRQNIAYPTYVGHFYYKHMELKDVSALEKEYVRTGLRVTGVNPSVEHLSVAYDIKTNSLVHPIARHNTVLPNDEKNKDALFTTSDISAKGTNALSGLEQVRALRYMIGLRGVNLCNYQFASSSQYVSIPFETDKEIFECSINTQFDVPSAFPEGRWVRYFISIDDGSNWLPISSRDHFQEGDKIKYIFNSNVQKEARLDEHGYINTKEPVTSILVKIELRRPSTGTDASYYTPTVRYYELVVTV